MIAYSTLTFFLYKKSAVTFDLTEMERKKSLDGMKF